MLTLRLESRKQGGDVRALGSLIEGEEDKGRKMEDGNRKKGQDRADSMLEGMLKDGLYMYE